MKTHHAAADGPLGPDVFPGKSHSTDDVLGFLWVERGCRTTAGVFHLLDTLLLQDCQNCCHLSTKKKISYNIQPITISREVVYRGTGIDLHTILNNY